MDQKERETLIKQYRDGYSAVAEALLKIEPEVLDARPTPGRWTVREIVHHLADSEMTAAVRLRLLLAEDRPTIRGYDQDEFAKVAAQTVSLNQSNKHFVSQGAN